MVAPSDRASVAGVETWEVMTEGTVWVWQMDERTRQYKKTRVGGNAGSKILRISPDDRRYNEEQVIEEMAEHNVFRNGALRLLRIDGMDAESTDILRAAIEDGDVDPKYHLTDEELVQYFEVRDEEVFRAAMEEITSELLIRRLRGVAEKVATQAQLAVLNEIIEERYKVGGTQRTVAEMMAAGEGTRVVS